MAYPGSFTQVSNYVTYARVMLQDQVAPFRYPDIDLVSALNMAFNEARRLRPDMFRGAAVPAFTANDTTAVSLDTQYQMAFIYYMTASAEMRDEEYTQDARVVAFMKMFHDQLVGMA